MKENKPHGIKKSKIVRVARPGRMILSAEESLRRMKDFPKRKDKFIAEIRGERGIGQMTLTIDISPETMRRLKISASIKGKELKNLVEQIVEQSTPRLDEAAAPLRDEIKRSGMSQAEIEDFFDDLVCEVRAETPLRSR